MRGNPWSAWLAWAALTGCAVLLGCSRGAPPSGLATRVVVTGLTFPSQGQPPAALQAVDAFPALSFDRPVVVTHAGDGTDRLFVAELEGRVHVFPNEASAASSELFLDLSSEVLAVGEAGFLGLAFDPEYADNGHFFVRYETPSSTPGMHHRSVISRFTVSTSDANAADPSSEHVLLEFESPYSNHNGGALAFGPDGMLYASIGDGGGSHDPQDYAQDLTTVLGKLLRLAPDGSIPADNPFVGAGGGVREEIWASGLRNPWRFSFDRDTGDLWLGDVGQSAREEIDLIQRGGDYGWDTFEGTLDHENPGGLPPTAFGGPVLDYPHSLGQSVTGGYVYRGSQQTTLRGVYLYGDFVTGRIWGLVWNGAQVVHNDEVLSVPNPATFGEDEAGELYVASFDGKVYRIEELEPSPAPAFPQLLSETGLFVDTAALEPTPGLVEYDVQTPLWSDGARKRRWMALPGWTQIDFDATAAWTFPPDTVLVKHFELETAPGSWTRLETRVLIHEAGGWAGYTYRWNEAQDDAALLTGGESEVLTLVDAEDGIGELTWNYPDRADCLACHTLAAGRVLGVRTAQLNGDFAYASVVDNQLEAWNSIELFSTDIGPAGAYASLPPWDEAAAATGERARAYLDVNCSTCHRPGGPTPSGLDLRFETPAHALGAVHVPPAAGDLGLTDPLLVWPGDKEHSVLWERLRVLDADRMPPLGSHRVHIDAVEIIGHWIDSGAP